MTLRAEHYQMLMGLVEASHNGTTWVASDDVAFCVQRQTGLHYSAISAALYLRTLFNNDMILREYATSGPPWTFWCAK